ncbi:DEAD/DEAH box helicase [Spirochaetota bacterium]
MLVGHMPKKYEYGTTAWGKYFIAAMEALADPGRLERGRYYAGRGEVLELSISGSRVRAKVAGNYMPWYDVLVEFSALPKNAVELAKDAFVSDTLLYGRIAGGDLPSEFLGKLKKAGYSLLPERWSDIKASCNCPDYGKPCKHQAAVYYILAQEIDRDPFTLLRLRGIDTDSLSGAAASGELFKTSKTSPPFNLCGCKAWAAPGGSGDPLAGVPALQSSHSAIPSMLPPSRGLAPFDLKSRMLLFYHHTAMTASLAGLPGSNAMDGPAARAFASSLFSWSFDSFDNIKIDSDIFYKEGFVHLKHGDLLSLAAAFVSCQETDGSPSYRFFKALFRAAVSICRAGAFMPVPVLEAKESKTKSTQKLLIIWKAAGFLRDVEAMLAALEGLAVAAANPGLIPDRRTTVELLLSAYITAFVSSLAFHLESGTEDSHPVVRSLFAPARRAMCAPSLKSLPAAMAAWLSVYELAGQKQALLLLIKPVRSGIKDEEAPVYRLSAAIKLDDKLIRLDKAAAIGGPGAQKALSFAALMSNFVPELARLGKHSSVKLNEDSLASFIMDASPILSRFGVQLELPKELAKLLRPRAALRAEYKKNYISFLDLDSAFAFDWSVAIGDERLSMQEFTKLLESARRLVRYRNSWVRLDPKEAAKIMELVSKKEDMGLMDGLRLGLSDEVEADGELPAILDLAQGRGKKPAALPMGLKAELRPYQERGFQWLLSNIESGMGCLLADDMGLGKTIQSLAVLLSLKERGLLKEGALVCAPASLLTNWQREAEKFAPELSVCQYYGHSRKLHPADLSLTSYETALRDIKKLSQKSWDLLIIDEAQYIKNPEARRAKAIKGIPSRARLALTGTPVENRLTELWSIFDFVLPGYLGGLSWFSSKYRQAIELDRSLEAASQLRKITSPFIIRRLKNDPEIAPELPDKIVIDEYTELVPEQLVLYEAISSEGLSAIENSEPEERLALVLALITALKQAANHPRNYDKESPGTTERSGKARLLYALLDSALDSGEKVLVFSQYVQMLDILAGIINRELGIEPYMLHGSMIKAARDRAVDAFQGGKGPGVFLVSLKAGGVGLNLTAASRVIHYDLWWNPSVENQATDRAYRIGQKQKVFVHRLITRNTIEERIDAMIQSKKELAGLTIKAGEKWIGKLSDSELRELVALR